MNPAPPVTTMLTTGQVTVGSCPACSCRRPTWATRERELLLDAFDSNWIAPLGPHVDAFEREFADGSSVWVIAARVERHRRARTSRSMLLGVGVPATRCSCRRSRSSATANVVTYVGARPVFVDSECGQLEHRSRAGRGRAHGPRPVRARCSRRR